MTEFDFSPLPMRIYKPGGTVEESEYIPTLDDQRAMRHTLDEAEQAGLEGDNAVACTLSIPSMSVTAQTREFRVQHLGYHAEELAYNLVQPLVGRDLSSARALCSAEPCYGCAYRFDKGSLGLLIVAASKIDVPEFFRNGDTLDHIWKMTRRELRVVSGLQKTRAIEILTRFPKKH